MLEPWEHVGREGEEGQRAGQEEEGEEVEGEGRWLRKKSEAERRREGCPERCCWC